MYAQVIHSWAHSLWGQVQIALNHGIQGLQEVLESFLLDLNGARMQAIYLDGIGTMATGQSFRPLRRSFQSLVTDLSTGCTDTFRSYTCVFKQVDKTLD
ncbi:hypothetical protein TU82_16115 [Pseudomonas orientalis]|nr:hypothetical protein TU82_16115 [Pseudomonas orientalis]